MIARAARARGITEIVHFTHQRALLGMSFTKALLPRSVLDETQILEYIVGKNAEFRSDDAWFGHVNLSIDDINRRFFGSAQRWHPRWWWVILAFDPGILDHDGVVFGNTNNAYHWTLRHHRGLDGFNDLYDTPLRHGGQWNTHPSSTSNLPPCPQAEVLYPGALSLDFLRRVYVRDADNYREACSFLTFLGRDVDVQIDPNRFLPAPTDLCQH